MAWDDTKSDYATDPSIPASKKRPASEYNAMVTYIKSVISASGTLAADVVAGGDVDFDGNDIKDAALAGFKVHDNGNSGTSATINWNNGAAQEITLTGNCTLSFTAPTGDSSNGWRMHLLVKQDGTGSRTITWPTITWLGTSGSAPTLSTSASAADLVTIWYDGSTYYGTASTEE